MPMNAVFVISLILSVVGAINWGLVGLFEFDLVAALLGPMSAASRVVYVLVGIAGVVLAVCAPMRRRAVSTTGTPVRR